MTLNQVVSRLEKLASSHKQVNHVYFGDMVEWLSNGEVLYPAVFIDTAGGAISKDNRATGWDFEVWFCDLANVAENAKGNELEVQSDLTSIAEDYKAMLVFNGYLTDWTVGETSQFSYFKEKFEDIVIAVKMLVHVDTRFDSSRCVVPTDLTFEPYTSSPGGSCAATNVYAGIAGENLGGGRVVYLQNGLFFLYDASSEALADMAFGITQGAALVGTSVNIQMTGVFTEVGLGLVAGEVYFAAPAGRLADTIAHVCTIIGIAVDANNLKMEIQQSIITI